MLEEVERRRLRLPESGLEIALLDWGGGGPLALLHHANGFCAATLALVADRLRERYRVVAMDARGHGDSSQPKGPDAYRWSNLADDLGTVASVLLRETGQRRIGLGFGHSFGGTLTFTVAARLPEMYERIALVDPVMLPAMNDQERAQRVRSRGLAERARKRRQRWSSREEARAFFAEKELFERWDPRALDLYVAEALRDHGDGSVELKCPGEVESAVFAGAGTIDLFEAAPRVQIPALLLWAVHGNFQRSVYQRIAERTARGRVEDLDAGHLAPMEEPDRVAEAVLSLD